MIMKEVAVTWSDDGGESGCSRGGTDKRDNGEIMAYENEMMDMLSEIVG